MTSTPLTRATLLRTARQHLRDAGIESSSLDARLLMLHALGIDDMALVRDPDYALTDMEVRAVDAVIARRIAREPVARILGQQEFYGLPFSLSADTLVPRPETEMLVDEALRLISADEAAHVLDLGTGTGCILLSILHARRNATGLGVDVAAGAVATALRNAQALDHGGFAVSGRARFTQGSWAAGIDERFDLVVSNPPYIDSAVVPCLAPEVAQHDPAAALDGGADGLDAYRAIVAALPSILKPGGWVLLEIGFDQARSVCGLLEAAGFNVGAVQRDLAGHDRLVQARR
ncbi:MAG: peptide chain release factor N(5)-glutamine methyltransferase [Beijerinckiaceae bacterium]